MMCRTCLNRGRGEGITCRAWGWGTPACTPQVIPRRVRAGSCGWTKSTGLPGSEQCQGAGQLAEHHRESDYQRSSSTWPGSMATELEEGKTSLIPPPLGPTEHTCLYNQLTSEKALCEQNHKWLKSILSERTNCQKQSLKYSKYSINGWYLLFSLFLTQK